uniref:Small ribosomal subunit protein uS15m n=1 Tax=Acartia pacifica TaxID=335913 RepID=A0A0U2URI7_ACAPC|nr:mitochondrial 28S ribosomal protein S15 [Acartia pacifica]
MTIVNSACSKLLTYSNLSMFNSGCLATTQQLRFKRRPNEKMEKPTDKSTVILGKIGRTTQRIPLGISDKQHPILLNWKRPQRIEVVNASISGDIGGLDHLAVIDRSLPPVELEGSKEFEKAEEEVKRVLSLEYGRRADYLAKLKKNVVAQYQRHQLDMDSIEVRIAMFTVLIRNAQENLINLYPYKNQGFKKVVPTYISKRRQLLEELRQKDYKKYEWILEKLNLFYKPVPKYDHVEVGRKASIERLTDLWCSELKTHRLNKYKRELQDEQPKFLRNKAAKLQHIMAEEADLGLQATVTQADIDECLRRAEQIELRNREEEKREKKLLIYKEEIAEEKNFLTQ